MTKRRRVRVDHLFFEDLDRQLGSDRGPNGEPSSTDFIVMDLPPVVDEFAVNFDALPMVYPDRPDYRVVIIGGVLVAAAVVIGQLVGEGDIAHESLGFPHFRPWPSVGSCLEGTASSEDVTTRRRPLAPQCHTPARRSGYAT